MARTKVRSIRDPQQPIQRRLVIHESSPESSCSKSLDSSVPPTPPADTIMTQSNNEVNTVKGLVVSILVLEVRVGTICSG